MATQERAHLRIYCLCGQKMKITPAAFGRNAKCVRCKQKIRVPEADEIPAGETEIHLHDHPEFLRQPTPRRTVATNAGFRLLDDDDDDEVFSPPALLGAPSEKLESVPVDVLPPLRTLLSLQRKAERQLHTLEDNYSGPEEGAGKAELEKRLEAIAARRATLETSLRQQLLDTALELENIRGEIANAGLSARVDEMDFGAYLVKAEELRRRREHLERRRQNIRGWLATDNLHMAGGYAELSFDDTPTEESLAEPLGLPSGELPDNPLPEAYCVLLYTAFNRLEKAKRKLREAKGMDQGTEGGQQAMASVIGDCEAQELRAEAFLAFCHKRLERLREDIASDLRLLERRTGARPPGNGANGDDSAAGQHRRALEASRSLVDRALKATGPEDVPKAGRAPAPRQELQAPDAPAAQAQAAAPPRPQSRAIHADNMAAWAAALMLAAAPLAPLAHGRNAIGLMWTPGVNVMEAHWFMSGPLAMALIVAFLALIPKQAMRGGAIAVFWIASTIAASFYLHMALYEPSPLGETIAAAGFLQPGYILFTLGVLVMGGAAVIALWATPLSRAAIPPVLLAAVAGVIIVLTDFAGVFRPSPALTHEIMQESAHSAEPYTVRVNVANAGGGSLILAPGSLQPNAYNFALETADDGGPWRDVSMPRYIRAGAERTRLLGGELPRATVPAGENMALVYGLGPGSYRAILSPNRGGRGREVLEFELEPSPRLTPAPPAEPEAEPETQPEDEAQPETQEAYEETVETPAEAEREQLQPPRVQQHVEAEIRGLLSGQDRPPSFAIVLHMPDGESALRTVGLGNVLYGDWTVEEYNPERQTATVSDGEDILILRRGDRVPLVAPPPQDEAPELFQGEWRFEEN